jgi:hypothetical protein
MESGRQKFRRTDDSVPQDSVPSNLGFTNADIPNNGAESLNPEDCTEAEFAHHFYEQLSNQPINVSGIMDDIAQRSCFDFESIAPLHNLGL